MRVKLREKKSPLPRGCSRGFAVHALRLRNELPLQGQFPEPKEFSGGVRERGLESWIRGIFLPTKTPSLHITQPDPSN
jgi:hypothetical protein